jgi:hypothetical protein
MVWTGRCVTNFLLATAAMLFAVIAFNMLLGIKRSIKRQIQHKTIFDFFNTQRIHSIIFMY